MRRPASVTAYEEDRSRGGDETASAKGLPSIWTGPKYTCTQRGSDLGSKKSKLLYQALDLVNLALNRH